jgi:hypothetical protein
VRNGRAARGSPPFTSKVPSPHRVKRDLACGVELNPAYSCGTAPDFDRTSLHAVRSDSVVNDVTLQPGSRAK